jgi:hypothetical protein
LKNGLGEKKGKQKPLLITSKAEAFKFTGYLLSGEMRI